MDKMKLSTPTLKLNLNGIPTKEHNNLKNLDFENSGHTGFQKELTTEQLAAIDNAPYIAYGRVAGSNPNYTLDCDITYGDIDNLLMAGKTVIFVVEDSVPCFLTFWGGSRCEFIGRQSETKYITVALWSDDTTSVSFSPVMTEKNTYKKTEIDTKFGDVEVALDNIIEIQNSLIGGES